MKQEIVQLRPAEVDTHAHKCMELLNNDKVSKFLAIRKSLSLDEERVLLQKLIDNADCDIFAIYDTENKLHIGMCSITVFDWITRIGDLGIFLSHTHHNRGYGTESLKKLIYFAFLSLNLNKLQSIIFEENHASIALHKKNGFVHEGTLRNGYYKNGNYHNLMYFGLLRKECS